MHTVALGVAVVCFGYNAIAFALRRERHLAVNLVVYGGVVWFEQRAVAQHGRRLMPASPKGCVE